MNALTRWIPRILFFIAAVHTVYGLTSKAGAWGDIADAGVWNGVGGVAERESAEWFFYAGMGFFIAGAFGLRSAQTTGSLPRELGWFLLFTGVTMSVIDPASGGWLLAALGVLTHVSIRQGTPGREPAERPRAGVSP
ncbi:DUF6463 family protein [Spirillospora sp. CA-294931]|uniref:DUF6463 family protein n=1 Tax=Spirillospora sp. CA-294931 TaxID=3240042 RepID=UPI003D93D7B3